MSEYQCTAELHSRCSNNVLCHLCDGESLFKDPVAEKKKKLRVREENKEAEKNSLLKVYKQEKKEGMAFEKRVASAWNDRFSGGKPKKKPAKPRLDMLIDEPGEEEATATDDIQYSPSFIPGKTNLSGLKPPQTTTRPPSRPRGEAQRQINSGAMWHSKGDIKLEHALMECKERGTTNSRGEKTISIPKLWLEKQEKEAFQEQRPYWYLPFGYKGDDAIYLVKPYNHEMEMIYEIRKLREENERLLEQLKKE